MSKSKFNLNELLSSTSLSATEPDAAEEKKPRRAPLKVVSLSVHDLIPSKENFYSVENIKELKDSIEMFGVKQNLTVKPLENGKYEVIAGHRRRLACLALVNEGKPEYEYVPCGIESERDEIKERLLFIMTNSTTRQLTDWEKTRQAEELRMLFEDLKKREKLPGRIRDLVAEALNTSAGQVGRMDAISNNLTPEFMKEFKEQRVGMSTAYELSGLPKEKQKEAFEEYKQKGSLSLNDVKVKKGSSMQPEKIREKSETTTAESTAKKPIKRDFIDLSITEKVNSAINLLNFYQFTIFRPSEDMRLYDFIIDALEFYKREKRLTDHSETEDVSDKCLNCWCNECGNFEDCIIEIEGYDIESKPCPCDGCHKRKKVYMPKEELPTCGNWINKFGGKE